MGHHESGKLFQRRAQFRRGIMESSIKEVCTANPGEIADHAIARIEALGGLEVFDRHIGLAGEKALAPRSNTNRAQSLD
jgi:hypothetical protein